MKTTNLLLKFELNGGTEVKVQQATRIRIDGQGSLLVYGNSSPVPQEISLDGIRTFSIQSVTGPSRRLESGMEEPVVFAGTPNQSFHTPLRLHQTTQAYLM